MHMANKLNAWAVIVLTAAVAILGVWLCTKVDKKSSKLLQ